MSFTSTVINRGTNWLQLANRTAIITGASSGIGHVTAQTLHDVGCHLILADINPPSVEIIPVILDDRNPTPNAAVQSTSTSATYIATALSTDSSLQPTDTDTDTDTDIPPPTVRRIHCDVTKRDDVDVLMNMAMDDSSVIPSGTQTMSSSMQSPPPASILINCAGVIRDRRVEFMTDDEWEMVLNVNLKGSFLTCQSFLQQRTQNVLCTSSASIINISSIVAQQGNIGQVNYAASKGGILGFTKALAKEVARRNVRVNAILPGFIQTSMSDQVPEHILTNVIQPRIALQRIGKPQEVANVIAFLASDRSSYMTGTAIECSGMISL